MDCLFASVASSLIELTALMPFPAPSSRLLAPSWCKRSQKKPHRLGVHLARCAPVAYAAQAEGMITGHQPKATRRHVGLGQHLFEANTALDGAVADPLGELGCELCALLLVFLGLLRVVWAEHILLAHLQVCCVVGGGRREMEVLTALLLVNQSKATSGTCMWDL